MHRSSVVVLSLLLGAANAGPAAARPAARSCDAAAAARGMTVAAHGARGSVYARDGEYFTCVRSRVRLHHVTSCCSDARFRLRGVWAASVSQGSAIGDETDKVAVVDMRTGRLRPVRKFAPTSEGAGPEIETSSFVSRLVLAADGAVAWIQRTRHADGTLGPDLELRAVAGRRAWERVVDAGALAPGSLRLSAGTLTWKKAGVTHRTALSEGPYRGRCSDHPAGTVVRDTPELLIVRRAVRAPAGDAQFAGQRYFGCAKPGGLVHPLGSGGAYYLTENGHRQDVVASETTAFGVSAGVFVVRRESYGSESAQTQDGDVVNLLTAATSTFYDLETDATGTSSGPWPPDDPEPVALGPTGLFAGVYEAEQGEGQRLLAMTPAGAIRTLDSGAQGAFGVLVVDGDTVSWTNGGSARTATVGDR